MKTVAVLLAAGASRRFGNSDKLLAELEGKPLIRYAIDALNDLEIEQKIAVISNPEIAVELNGYELLPLQHADNGQSASLIAGVAAARRHKPDRLLVCLADMPFVSAALIQRVIDRSTATSPAALSDGRRISPPACFPSVFFDVLGQLSGDRGARAILNQLPESALVKTTANYLLDIDQQADLAQAKKSSAGNP